MANEITLKTRLLNKYNQAIADDVTLGAGEINFVEVNIPLSDGSQGKAVLMKVGDGTTTYGNLDYVAAKAADVYAWAKEEGLTVQKEGTGNVISGIAWDATLNGGKGGIKITTASVATLEGLAELQNKVQNNIDAITAIKDGTTIDSFADVETALSDKVDKVEGKSLVSDTEIARLANVKNYDDTQVKADIATNTTAANNAKAAADTAQAGVDAIKADYLKSTDKTELSDAITTEANRAKAAEKTNADAIATIKADYLTSEDKTELTGAIGTVEETAGAAKTAIDAFLKDADVTTNAVDTLKEIQAELDAGEASAANLLSEINALKAIDNATQAELDSAVETLNTAIGKKADTTTVTAIDGRVTSLENADYATTTQVATAKSEAISAAASDATTKANKAYADAIAYADEHDQDTTYTAGAGIAISNTNVISNTGVLKVETGATNGTIKVDGTEIAVKGLGSAAYTESSAYATAAQGTKADSAIQTVVSGSANGTIAVDGTDVNVTGLGSAAYTESSAYATSAQGTKADSALQTVKVLGKDLTKTSNELTVAEAKTALGLKSAAYTESSAYAPAAEGLKSVTYGDGLVATFTNNILNIDLKDSSTGFTFILDANA